MPKSRFSAVSVFSLDSSNLCREVKKLQVFYIESFPPAVALDSKIRLSPIYSKYCKWIIFGRKIFKVPAMYSTCCKWLFTNFLFFRQNFFKSPLCTPLVASGWSYVLHILQVANFWNFFFRSLNYSKSPQRTPHVASGFWATFYFLVKIFLSPRYLLHLLQVAAGRKTVFRSLCFFAR